MASVARYYPAALPQASAAHAHSTAAVAHTVTAYPSLLQRGVNLTVPFPSQPVQLSHLAVPASNPGSQHAQLPASSQTAQQHSAKPSVQSSALPQLLVLRQTSPNEEKSGKEKEYPKEKDQKPVHVVVKNAPFIMQVAVSPNFAYGRVINLNHLAFDAVLLYDTEPPFEKSVDFVKVKPVEYKAKITEQGDQATLELRIKVLTSQHENSYFRIKLMVVNPTSGDVYHPSLVTFSDPIKVISKPEQIKKKQNPSKKRTLNDSLADTISRIEEQQLEQQRVIERLLEQQKKNQQNLDACFSLDALTGTDLTGPTCNFPLRREAEKCDKGTDFEVAFSNFLAVFNGLVPEERPTKIRKLIRNCNTHETEKISELLEGLSSNSSKRHATSICSSLASSSSCACKQCPYQKELERIDEFYKDFLSAPLANETE